MCNNWCTKRQSYHTFLLPILNIRNDKNFHGYLIVSVTQQNFESEELTIIENPADATAYGDGSHTFSCKFPNPFVGDKYEIVWSFKGADDAVAMVCDNWPFKISQINIQLELILEYDFCWP